LDVKVLTEDEKEIEIRESDEDITESAKDLDLELGQRGDTCREKTQSPWAPSEDEGEEEVEEEEAGDEDLGFHKGCERSPTSWRSLLAITWTRKK
jgi:hypothetical protein